MVVPLSTIWCSGDAAEEEVSGGGAGGAFVTDSRNVIVLCEVATSGVGDSTIGLDWV